MYHVTFQTYLLRKLKLMSWICGYLDNLLQKYCPYLFYGLDCCSLYDSVLWFSGTWKTCRPALVWIRCLFQLLLTYHTYFINLYQPISYNHLYFINNIHIYEPQFSHKCASEINMVTTICASGPLAHFD